VERHDKYSLSKFADDPWDPAILANLNPSAADAWAFEGTTPSDKGLKFVADVKAFGQTYWTG
jgi:hypothetical protein